MTGRRVALVLVSHPDDAEIGMAMRLAHLSRTGTPVHVHCFTRGSPAQAEQRLRECQAAGSVLGVHDYSFADLPENHLSSRISEINDATHQLMQRLRPASVFTHFPGDQHPDHVATGTTVTATAKREVPHIEQFRSPYSEGFQPNRIVLADEGLWEIRQKALSCFASQAQLPTEALEAAGRFGHHAHLHHRVTREYGELPYSEQFVLVREVQPMSLPDGRLDVS